MFGKRTISLCLNSLLWQKTSNLYNMLLESIKQREMSILSTVESFICRKRRIWRFNRSWGRYLIRVCDNYVWLNVLTINGKPVVLNHFKWFNGCPLDTNDCIVIFNIYIANASQKQIRVDSRAIESFIRNKQLLVKTAKIDQIYIETIA